MKIRFIDRQSGRVEEEKVYGAWAIRALYGSGPWSRMIRFLFLGSLCRFPLFSQVYGWWQRKPWTRRKILPFIDSYGIDPNESELPPEEYPSFDAFFSRRLRPSSRPLAPGEQVAIIPTDGRYWIYPDLSSTDGFFGIKGKRFQLLELLQDASLARQFEKGSAILGRLCPSDYHRFHFPCRGIPERAKAVAGALYSVNPLAIRQNIRIYCENKRYLTHFHTPLFGELLMIEIGATNVGTVHQTYTPGKEVEKGEEKGYFSFGGSAIVLLFEPGRIFFEQDLIDATQQGYEIRCLLGQPLGVCST